MINKNEAKEVLDEAAAKEIKELQKDWLRSGKTQRAYCAKKGMGISGFKNRLQKGRDAGIIGSMKSRWRIKRQDQNTFVPLKISVIGEEKIASLAPYCEIKFEGKTSIRIERADSMSHLKLLIETLNLRMS